jgi:membrane associated rhomboid family serine protease
MNGERRISLRVPVTAMVRKIMLANAGVYLVTVLALTLFSAESLAGWARNLFLTPPAVLGAGKIWTLATYAWFHDLGQRPLMSVIVCAGAIYAVIRLYKSRWGQQEFFLFLLAAFLISSLVNGLGYGAPLHLAGNMLGLYFFGHIFEDRWGPRRFLSFWLACTIGGGVCSTLFFYVWPSAVGVGPIVGASAGVLGLVAAYAVYFPEQQVLFGLLVPIRGKHFLWIVVAFDLLSLLQPGNVAVFAHLGGIAAALLLCTGYWRPSKLMAKLSDPKSSHLRLVMPDDDDDDKDDEEPRRYLH